MLCQCSNFGIWLDPKLHFISAILWISVLPGTGTAHGGEGITPAVSQHFHWGPQVVDQPFTHGLYSLRQVLRGGSKKGKPKSTLEERAEVAALELTPEQEKDLRRHWKKKPEWYVVKKGGVEKKVRTKTILNVFKDRALDRKRQLDTLPFKLLDLGTKGLMWIRSLLPLGELQSAVQASKPRRELTGDEQLAVEALDKLFSGVDGYTLAKDVRPQLMLLARPAAQGEVKALPAPDAQKLIVGMDPKDAIGHVGSHTYGEIDPRGFAEILHLAEPKHGEVFVDLGSGTGKAVRSCKCFTVCKKFGDRTCCLQVLLATSLFPFARAYGYEIVRPLHEAAVKLLDQFENAVVSNLPLYAKGKHKTPRISMKLGDAMQSNWANAGIVFAASTCWTQESFDKLQELAQKLKKGARVIVMTRPLNLSTKTWKLKHKKMASYGKGRLTFYMYEKLVD